MEITGIRGLTTALEDHIKSFEDKVAETRREVARFLIEAMLKRTPVWSGDTAGSFFVTNGSSSSGRKHNHKPNQRGTNAMPLGRKAEKYSASAWAKSLSTVGRVNYSIEQDVYVRNDSDIWEGIDAGRLPSPRRARNKGGVSDVAVVRTKNKFRKVVS